MTHYSLTQHAVDITTRHGINGDAQLSTATQAYLDRAKRRLAETIEYNPEWIPEGSSKYNPDRWRWVECPTSNRGRNAGLRLVGPAHDLARKEGWRMHTGWYCDSFQDSVAVGEVYQLPGKDGKARYIPAVKDPDGNDAAVMDFHSVTDDLQDAIRWADSMAEKYAENSRESEAKDRAESRIEEIGEEIDTTRKDIRELTAELKTLRGTIPARGVVCSALRGKVKAMRQGIRELQGEREKLQDNFWKAVEGHY